MKYLPALILLLATALIQALGVYRYSNDAITMSGQVFFPILFSLAAAYISFKAPKTSKYMALHYAVAAIGVILLILTIVGIYSDMYWFYPTTTIYYIALVFLIVEAALAIVSVPKAGKDARPVRQPKKKAVRGAHLVAVAKPASAEGSEQPAEQKDV